MKVTFVREGDEAEDVSGDDPIRQIEKDYGYPPALAKACVDEFDYTARLEDGTLVHFRSASAISREWVALAAEAVLPATPNGSRHTRSPSYHRGLDVRVDRIVWVGDSIFGS